MAETAALQLEDPRLAEAVRRLATVLSPLRIYLFGSRARGDDRADSDYDLLAVVAERLGEPYEMEQSAYAAVWDLDLPIDVVVMTDDYYSWMREAAASLPATVDREGRLLYAA